MGRQKKEQIFSVNPDLWKRSHEPTMTTAMGIKPNSASAICWKAQVDREYTQQRIWQQLYDPENNTEKVALKAIENTIQRGKDRREAYSNPEKNPELYTILYRQSLDTATNRFQNKQRKGSVDGELSPSSPGPTGGVKGTQHGGSKVGATELSSVAHLPPVRRTQPYLEARYENYTPRERFSAHGKPPTTSLCVGWHCQDSMLTRSAVELYMPVKPNVMGPYRMPEDAEHAALFGYDLDPK